MVYHCTSGKPGRPGTLCGKGQQLTVWRESSTLTCLSHYGSRAVEATLMVIELVAASGIGRLLP